MLKLGSPRTLMTFGFALALGAQISCTRDPLRSGSSDQPVNPNQNSVTSVPTTGDARNPDSSDQSSSASQAQPTTSDAKRSQGDATSVGSVGSDKAGSQELAPTNTGTMPQDRKGIVGSQTASNIAATQPSQPVNPNSQIDVTRYTYDRRGEFKTFMAARLEGVSRNLQNLKTNTNAPTGGGDVVIKDLAKKDDSLKSKLNEVDSVSPQNWDSYKQSFRNDVTVLERSVQKLSTVSR